MHLFGTLPVAFSLLLTRSLATPVLQPQGNSTSTTSCAIAAAAQAQYVANNPKLRTVDILANQTYDCLRSVPVQKDHTLKLVHSLKAWYQLESQLDYIKNPAPGFLWDGIDLMAHLDRIGKNVENNAYQNQYDIEVELITLSKYFHDFHTQYRGEISSTATFMRSNVILVSASIDGFATPQIYMFGDIVRPNSNLTGFIQKNDSRISPVQSINGMDTQQFLQTQQLVVYSHDPDNMYNQLFYGPVRFAENGGLGSFNLPVFYPGSQTVLRFANGTSNTYANTARTGCNMTNVKTGQDYWNVCVLKIPATTIATTRSATATIAKRTASPTVAASTTAMPVVTQLPYFYPEPLIIDSAGVLSGYYLEDEGYGDVAVLVLKSFANKVVPNWLDLYQEDLEYFLAQAVADNKTKLIIDLQGNGGGYVDAGTELVAQLFPNVPPTQKGNVRHSPGLEVALAKMGAMFELLQEQVSDETEDLELEDMNPYAAFTWEAIMTPNASAFTSFSDFWGPKQLQSAAKPGSQGNYSNFFQTNYTNKDPTDSEQNSIQITGYGNRKLPANTKPPFSAKNIVVLSDGFCGSTCSIVAETLINEHQVRAITIGGRPISAPMQTVGNTKGSQVWPSDYLEILYEYYANETLVIDNGDVVVGTAFEDWDEIALKQGLIRLNAKNNYRLGDKSETVLAQVYTASDCKMWYDFSMMTDVSKVWSRAAGIAFPSKGKAFESPYCVNGSTKHSTSVSGGLKKGQIGNQTPPAGAKPKYLGWLKNGVEIVQAFSLGTPGIAMTNGTGPSKTGSLSAIEPEKEANLVAAGVDALCIDFDLGDKWFLKMICAALG